MDNLPATYGRAQDSRSSPRQDGSAKPKVSAATKALIGELALRYPPPVAVSAEQHAAQIALLACDVADIAPDILEEAIAHHVRSSPYMPKASDLIALAQNIAQARRKGMEAQHIARGNAYLREIGRTDCEWYFDGNNCRMRHIERARQHNDPPCTPAQAAAIMAEFGLKHNPMTTDRGEG